jgi:SAM-dependent methyltransferase
MIGGYCLTQAIYVTAKLGIVDRLRGGPQTADRLSRLTGTHAGSLHRLLRMLTSIGVFAQDRDGRFRLTELGALLRTDIAGSLRNQALAVGDTHYAAFGELLHGITTGHPGFDKAFGAPLFDYLAENQDAADTFDAALADLRSQATDAVLDVCDFAAVGSVVDVGSGPGGLLFAILRKYPSIRGVLFDRPAVVNRAETRLDDAGIAARCAFIGGDFFEGMPADGDVYLMRHVIHDWDDARATQILRNCRRSMGNGGKLLLVESIIEAGNEPSLGKWMDLLMLALTGGMERTEQEYRELLSQSGFRLERVTPSPAGIHVMEALPIAQRQPRQTVRPRRARAIKRERSMSQ